MALTFKLSSGQRIPALGFGTWQSAGPEVETAVDAALSAGYRHIDTAAIYENEEIIGRVLNKWFDSGRLKREDVFIVTKLPPIGNRAEDVEEMLTASLKKLQLSYVDVYLIHLPMGIKKPDQSSDHSVQGMAAIQLDPSTDLEALWKGMEAQVDAGRTKSIGISNFNASQVERIVKVARIPPVTNQVELHLYFQQPELVSLHKKNNILTTAHSPLGTPGIKEFYKRFGKEKDVPDILNHPVVLKLARKYKKTGAQIILRHHIEKGICAIPKSTNSERIKQNIDIFDFALSKCDVKQLNELDQNCRIVYMDLIPGIENHPEYPFKK